MPAPIEQALITLVPSLNTLPPELLSLATALLSQSTSKASTLKPEEEIGRVYACAHIACERLKARLGLDKFQPRPPVPPQVYKRLYSFLDAQLAAPSTPRTKRVADMTTPTSGTNRTPASRRTANGTPSRKRSLEPDETPSRRSEKRARPTPSTVEETVDADAMIGSLAKVYGLSASALRSAAGRHLDPDLSAERTAGLLIAVSILQTTATRPRPLTAEQFATLRDKGLASLGLENDADVLAAVNEWLRTAGREGWVATWAKTQAQTPLRRAEKHAAPPETEDGLGPAGLVMGLGSMFQDAVDWLSAERCEDYAAWESEIRHRIQVMTAQKG